ncbi:MAG TPA: protein-disulfide reductase DsbD [Candidatus Competibacteraceae bacterium]|nr:protein-disulfide reductase DsbD [Candidatus Competibacteraceae bacterium]HQA25412.1 protein-disulfide reductase DsbD [Candidatus Competibacteraceae bacterium]HQD56082.1 protein-disulfide reductase DsbD [Candidatus Competibacteraceae bacterium]
MKHLVRAGFGLLWLVLVAMPAMAGLFDRLGGSPRDKILEADQAFQLTLSATDPQTLEARWLIAPGYYLYRDKFQLSIPNAPGIQIVGTDIAAGEPKDDPHFGRQEIYHNEAVLVAHLQRDAASAGAQDISVKADYQGCAEVGVCYPPLSQTVTVSLPALAAASTASTPPTASPAVDATQATATPKPAGGDAEQDRLARLLDEQRFLAIPAFFGFGLLLAFTPCIFPMIPILSSLIAGQGANLTRRRAILLSLTYVLAMAVTYTIAGVLAALLGQNVQAWFQNPWVIGAFSGLFLLLALSMFGLYDLQLPGALQNRLVAWSNRQRGGHHAGVAVMGLLSALIVGPCVAPPLIGALSFIAVTGNVTLGAAALFALSLGMGAPLLIIGASAGHWLPRAGHWMERTKSVFGVLLLGVALWLLERILPAALTMVLWATLLIVTATYMGALQPAVHGAPAWRTLIKGLGLVLLIYGILLLVGVAAGGRDPWQPLRGIGLVAQASNAAQQPRFRTVKTVAEVEQAVGAANGRPVMLDFYADWCVSCKEMERYTFADPTVQAALADMVTLRADVTANDAADQALLKRFGLIGPPAILFFGPDGRERSGHRVVGFVEAAPFAAHLRTLPAGKN